MKIAACLLLQACLLLFRPGLLPVWGDEQFTLDACLGAFDRIAPIVAADRHPPGYFWLVWLWLRAVPIADPLVSARLLSALIMLGATGAFWALFLRRLPDRPAAQWVMIAWTLSPFALLYGRMARSYGLQFLVFLIAVRSAEKALESGRFVRAGLLAALVLYVHYIPGFCLLVLVVGRLLMLHRWRNAGSYGATAAAAFSPWIATVFATASRELGNHGYLVFGGHTAEHPLRFAYTWVSWHFGETLPLPFIAAGLPLSAIGLLLAWHAAARNSGLVLAFSLAAAAAYLLVSRVLIFALVPARLLFVVPFYAILVASGRGAYPRLARASAVAILYLDGIAIGNYFIKDHFLNKGYLVPFDEIVRRFEKAKSGIVLVDIHSIDTSPVWPKVPTHLRSARVADERTAGEVRDDDPVVFHIRGSLDRSRGRVNDALDRELAKTRTCVTEGFTRYDRHDHWLMDRLGWPEKPGHLVQLVTCRR